MVAVPPFTCDSRTALTCRITAAHSHRRLDSYTHLDNTFLRLASRNLLTYPLYTRACYTHVAGGAVCPFWHTVNFGTISLGTLRSSAPILPATRDLP